MKKPTLIVKYVLTVMKLTVLQIVLSAAFSGVVIAGDALGQDVLDKTLSISASNKSLRLILSDIESSTEIKFTFNPKSIPVGEKISVKFENARLKDVLDEMFEPLHIVYEVSGKYIILNKGIAGTIAPEGTPHKQLRVIFTVNGTVRDENSDPLPGVNVVEKGTSNGTTTDVNGSYTLNITDERSVLVFTFIGYSTLEETVSGRSQINVSLQPSIQSLQEVVVIGYGSVERKDVTGSIGSVNNKDLKDLAIARADQALMGKVAGVQVIPVSGEPGVAPQIRIRGVGSISAGSSPLYVVDGFPTDNIQSLNPADIETMDVLKDASATAIYGSRGANGVIIINTKRGKAGAARINFDTYVGFQKVSKNLDFFDAQTQAQYYYDGIRNRNLDAGNNISGPAGSWAFPVPATVMDVLEGRNTLNVDATAAVLQTAPQQSYQLSANGGTEKIKYAVSGEHLSQEGIIINSNFKRYGFRSNLDAQLSEKLSMRLNLNAVYTTSRNVTASGGGGGQNEGVIAQATSAQPYYPLYNADGSYFVYNNIDASTVLYNPVAVAMEIYNKQERMRLMGNINLDYQIIKDLKLSFLFGTVSDNLRGMKFMPNLPVFFNNPATGTSNTAGNLNWLTETTLNYTKSFGRHNISGLLGYTAQKDNTQTNILTSNNYPNNLVPTLSAVSNLITTGSSELNEWSLISYLARANYNFDSKYYVTASIRTDGSSRFGSNSKYGIFPSAALAWRISDENFMDVIPVLSEMKLRTSYGETGNNNIGNYEHFATIAYEKYTLGEVAIGGFGPGRISNNALTWEKQRSFNIGLDAAFFENRLRFSVDRFLARNTDLLLNVNVPQITGYATALQNIGEVKNEGWEFVLGTDNFTGAFKWTTDFNISTYRNEVLKLGPEGDPIIVGRNITMIGQPIGMFYGLLVDGIFENQAEVDAGPMYNPGGADHSRPGDIKFVDVSGPEGVPDGIINSLDYTIMGSPYPDYYLGMTNNFSFRNFSLVVGLQGTYGNQIQSDARIIQLLTRSRSRTLSSQINWWKSEADPGDGNTPRPHDAPTGGIRVQNSRYIETGTYTRINNITLSYNFPQLILNRLKLNSLRVYANATNPFIFTKNTSFNPDVSNSGNALTPGIDANNYPLPKSLNFGLNIGL